MVSKKQFREDLFYRFNVIKIELPPLRERKEDISILAGHFINKFNKILDKKIKGIDEKALTALESYKYPGNIRELENIIERAIKLTEKDKITINDLGICQFNEKGFENFPRGTLFE